MLKIKIETPHNLDEIFSLEAFKFNDMKKLFHLVFGHLQEITHNVNELDNMCRSIPDMTILNSTIKDLNNRAFETEKLNARLKDRVEQNTNMLTSTAEKLANLNEENHRDHGDLLSRLAVLEREVEDLKLRPVGSGDV